MNRAISIVLFLAALGGFLAAATVVAKYQDRFPVWLLLLAVLAVACVFLPVFSIASERWRAAR